MTKSRSLIAGIHRRLSERARRRRFTSAVEHLHGSIDVPEGEVLAIVLVRDGAYYMDEFFAYYRSLGIRYFAFMDNGSCDGTVERLRGEAGCVVDKAMLPLAQYEDLLRAYPAQTYGRNRWCLYIDMDEQFDFVGRDKGGLPVLLRYLETKGHTALMAQMLEMFPRAPLASVQDLTFSQALEAFDHYDVSTVQSYAYHSEEIEFEALLRSNELSSDELEFKFGGVRGKVFGETCCLTKHPLVFNGEAVVPAPHPHLSQHVVVSDMSAVIRHYKFAGNVVARDAASAQSGDLAHGEDAARLEVLEGEEALTLYSDDARKWAGIVPLQESGFLVKSKDYEDMLSA